MARLRRLAELPLRYLQIAWWGLVAPHWTAREPLRVLQGVVLSERGVLLSVRSDLRGWELPGGTPRPGEPDEAALRRELREETGVEVRIERLVGDYERTGFRPHTARVFACRAAGGTLRPSAETPRVAWFGLAELPDTLLPWYRGPLADALAGGETPVRRREHQGAAAVLAGMAIDLRMRLSGDRAGRP